jgi:hypothetical protein
MLEELETEIEGILINDGEIIKFRAMAGEVPGAGPYIGVIAAIASVSVGPSRSAQAGRPKPADPSRPTQAGRPKPADAAFSHVQAGCLLIDAETEARAAFASCKRSST